MRFKRRAPTTQLWVFYNQVGGYWRYRVSNSGVTFWGGGHYPTEFAAIDSAEQIYAYYFLSTDPPLADVRVFRTNSEYARALAADRRRR